MKNYIESTIYISGKYLVAVMAITTSLVFSQNLSGDWSGDVSSFQNTECAGDPFVVNNIQLSLESDGLLHGEIFADYTFEDICGMIGGEVEDDGLCHSASSTSSASELMPTYCQLFEGEYDGQTCHTEDTIQGSWTLEENAAGDPEFCVTTIDSETNEPVTECGPAYIGVDDNGEIYELDFTITNFADSEDDSDSCVLFSLERDDDGGGPCEVLNCDNLHLVSIMPMDPDLTFFYGSNEEIAMGIQNGELRYGVTTDSGEPPYDENWSSAYYMPEISDPENDIFIFAWEYPEGYPEDSLYYYWQLYVDPPPDFYGYTPPYGMLLANEWNDWLVGIGPWEDPTAPQNSCLAFFEEPGSDPLRLWDPFNSNHISLLQELYDSGPNEEMVLELWNFDSFGSCEGFDPGGFPDEPEDDLTEVGFYLSNAPCAMSAGVFGSWNNWQNAVAMEWDEIDEEYYTYIDIPVGTHEFEFVCLDGDGVIEFSEDLNPELECAASNGNRVIDVPMLDDPEDWFDFPDTYWGECFSDEEYDPICETLNCENLHLVSAFPQRAIDTLMYYGSSLPEIEQFILAGNVTYNVRSFTNNNPTVSILPATYIPEASEPGEGLFVFAWEYAGGYPDEQIYYSWSAIDDVLFDYAMPLLQEVWSWLYYVDPSSGEDISCLDTYEGYYSRSWDPADYATQLDSISMGYVSADHFGDTMWNFDTFGSCEVTDNPEPMLTEVGFYLQDAPCAGYPGVIGSWNNWSDPVQMTLNEYWYPESNLPMDFYAYIDLPPGTHEFEFVCLDFDGNVEFSDSNELAENGGDCIGPNGHRVIDVPMLEDPEDWHDLPDYSWGQCPAEGGPCEVLNCNNLHLVGILPTDSLYYYYGSNEEIAMAIENGEIEYGVTNSYDEDWSSAYYIPEISDPENGGFIFAWEYPAGYPDDTLYYYWEVLRYPSPDDYGEVIASEWTDWLTYISPEEWNEPQNSCLTVFGEEDPLRFWDPFDPNYISLLQELYDYGPNEEMVLDLWNFDAYGNCEGFNPGDGPDGPGMDYTLSNYTIEVFNADHYYDEAIAENSMPYLYIDNSPGVVVRAVFENTTDDGEEGAMAGLLSIFVDTNVNGYLDSLDLNVSGGGSIGDDGPNFNQKVILLVDNGPNDMDNAVGYFAGDFTDMDVLRIQGATVFFASIDPNMEQNNINEVKEVRPMSNEGQRFTGQTALFDSDVPVPGIVFAAMAFEPNGGYRLGITDEQGMFNIGASFQGFDVEINQLHHHLDRNVAVFQDTSDYVFIPASVSENGYDLGVFGAIDVIRLNTLVQGMIFDQNNSPWLGGFMDVRYDIGLVNDNNQSGSINKHYRLYPDNGHYMYWTLNGTEVEHQYGDSFSNHIQEEHVYVFSDQFDEQLDAYLFYHDYSWEGMSDFGTVSGYVYGEIYNAENGEWSMEPLANVPVDIWSVNDYYTTYSGEDGYYSIDLPAGDYTISSSADLPGLVSNGESHYFSLYAGGSTSFNLYYESQGNELVHIEGQVVSSGGGSLYDAQVWFEGVSDTSFWDDTFTNNDGIYDMELPYGTYNVAAQYNGHYVSWQYDVLLDGHTTVNFFLEVVENFTGSVQGLINFNGQMPPEENAYLNIFNDTYDVRFFAGDDGFFSVDLVDGIYTVFVVAPGYADFYQEDAFEVSGNMVTFDFDMFENGFVGAPHIVSLYDVPNDQGRQMRNVWDPGNPGEWDYFTQFSIWRKVNGAPIELWDYIETVPWHGMNTYAAVVPTLGDSSMHEMYESTFIVTAHTDDVNFFVDSEPVSGYSVDNLHPSAPMAMMAVQGGDAITLSWSSSIDSDFSYYSVYRQDVGSSEEATVFTTTDSFYVDQNIAEAGSYEYWVTAVDLSGLESDASNSVSALLSADMGTGMPTEFALNQNYPNPFNPSTQIRYALPEESMVTISIYDLMGRKVRTLVNDVQSAGYRTAMWNATNDMGRAVSAGMYIYTIQAGDFVMNRKMVLMK